MNIYDALIPACTGVIITLIIIGVPFAYAAFVRDLRSKETLKMIEKGILEAPKTKENGKGALRWGIGISALGLALSIGLYPLGYFSTFNGINYPIRFGPWMIIGLVPLFFGLALVLIHYVTIDKEPDEEKEDKNTKA